MTPGHRINLIDQCAYLIWDTKFANDIPHFMRELGIEKLSTTDP